MLVADRADRKNRIALLTIGGFIGAGAIAAAIYGIACANPNRTDALLYIGILMAGVISGGLIGFLFGLPRFKFEAAPAPAAAGTVAAIQAPGQSRGIQETPRYRPSSNLDDGPIG